MVYQSIPVSNAACDSRNHENQHVDERRGVRITYDTPCASRAPRDARRAARAACAFQFARDCNSALRVWPRRYVVVVRGCA
eukprot:11222273-Lingulodinium_polyedra.AAC.1